MVRDGLSLVCSVHGRRLGLPWIWSCSAGGADGRILRVATAGVMHHGFSQSAVCPGRFAARTGESVTPKLCEWSNYLAGFGRAKWHGIRTFVQAEISQWRIV